jgi:two-component system cell cycle sensor histidine kinase/response regulator CckA
MPAVGDAGASQGKTHVGPYEKLLALRDGQARVLEMIATNAPLGETLAALVRLIEAQVTGLRCSILLLDDDGVHLRHGAAPSLPESYVKAIDGAAIGPSAGSCGTAAFLRRTVVVTDLMSDPLWADYRHLAERHGLRACWSTPILSPTAQVLGTFAIYYGEPHGPSPAEEELVDLGTHVAAIAIEQKRREEALRASEAKYRDLYTSTPVMMHSIDKTGRLVSISRSWLESLGYEEREVLGRPSVDFLTPASRKHAVEVVLPAFFATGGCKNVAYQFVKKNGETMDVLLSGIAERDPDGTIARSLAVSIDVTQHKRLEERLWHSQKMEALWRLAGGVAHDFNNILAAILLNTEVLLKTRPDPALTGGLGEIQRAVERGAALTRQLLAFSRKQLVEPSVLDLNEIVRAMEDMLRRLIREDVRLVASLAQGLGLVKADRNQLEQVILNLAVNARDAMPKGGELTIATADLVVDEARAHELGVAAAGAYVQLSVRDTGTGMDSSTRSRLFEPFFTTKEQGKGTGLGLATVDGIVRQSGGVVRVESELGRGTTFFVILPRVSGPRRELPAEKKTARGPARSETILVVEDEGAVRSGVREILQASGYVVLDAADGREALRVASEHQGPIHLLVSDAVMPGMGGDELAQRLVALRPELGIVFISGYVGEAIVQRTTGRPTAFLPKPFSAAALSEKVREVLDRR